jgi:hypothetical protein
LVVSGGASLDSVSRLFPPTPSELDRQIQDNGEVGLEPSSRNQADLPDAIRIYASCVPLVDHVGEKVTIRDDSVVAGQRRLNHLRGQFGPTRHEEEHLAEQAHRATLIEKESAQTISNWSSTRISALNDLVSLTLKPLSKQGALR